MRFPHNRRHQAIPGLGDGLDVLRALPAVAGKRFTQLRNRLGHHIVGRQGIGPHLGKQLLACDHLARLARQGQQHRQRFGRQARRTLCARCVHFARGNVDHALADT